MLVPAGLAFSNFLIGALVVAALYFTSEISCPDRPCRSFEFCLVAPCEGAPAHEAAAVDSGTGSSKPGDGYRARSCGDGHDRGQPARGRPATLSVYVGRKDP
jgi:hypothetical protein